MIDSLEAAFGSRVQLRSDSPLGQANQSLGVSRVGLIAQSLDRAIQRINSTSQSNVDHTLTPNLGALIQAASTHHLQLPTLENLRSEEAVPDARQAVDTVFDSVNQNPNVLKSPWGWLITLDSRQRLGSFFLEGYQAALHEIPFFQEQLFADPRVEDKTLVLAIEEVLGIRQLSSTLARSLSLWYQAEEGFDPDFLDYLKMLKIFKIGHPATKLKLTERSGVANIISLAANEPRVVLNLFTTFSQAVGDLNQMANQDIDPMLINIQAVAPVLRERPLPVPLAKPTTTWAELSALIRGFKHMNGLMKAGELYANSQVPPDVDYLRFHLDARSHLAISSAEVTLAGFLVHGMEAFASQFREYQEKLPKDALTNAICEVLGFTKRSSRLFSLLYYPEFGLSWYTQEWGFSERFIDSLSNDEILAN